MAQNASIPLYWWRADCSAGAVGRDEKGGLSERSQVHDGEWPHFEDGSEDYRRSENTAALAHRPSSECTLPTRFSRGRPGRLWLAAEVIQL